MEEENMDGEYSLPVESDGQDSQLQKSLNPELLFNSFIFNSTRSTLRDRHSKHRNQNTEASSYKDISEFIDNVARPNKPKFLSLREIPWRKETQTRMTKIQLNKPEKRGNPSITLQGSSDKPQISDIYKKHILNVSTQQHDSLKYPHQSRHLIKPNFDILPYSSSIRVLSLDQAIRQHCFPLRNISTEPTQEFKFFKALPHSQQCSNALEWPIANRLIVGMESAILVVDWQSSEVVQAIQPSDCFSKITTISCSKSVISTGETSGVVGLYDLPTTSLLREIHIGESFVKTIDWKNDKVFSVGSDNEKIGIYDIRGESRSASLPVSGVNCLRWQPNGHHLACGKQEGVQIFDIRNPLKPTSASQNISGTKDIGWHQSDRLVISGRQEDQEALVLWDIYTQKSVKSTYTKFSISGLRINSATKQVISIKSTHDNNLCVWSLPQMWTVAGWRGDSSPLAGIAVNQDLNKCATISTDSRTRVWDLSSKEG